MPRYRFVPIPDEVLEAATPNQARAIQAYNKHRGSRTKAAQSIGVNSSSFHNLLERAKKNAALRGWSPDHDMTHMTPDTHLVKGTSTLYGDDGQPKL